MEPDLWIATQNNLVNLYILVINQVIISATLSTTVYGQ